MNEVIWRLEAPLLRYDVIETGPDDFISDAVRETTGAEVGSTNGLRYAPPIPPGPLTEGDLWSLLPLAASQGRGFDGARFQSGRCHFELPGRGAGVTR